MRCSPASTGKLWDDAMLENCGMDLEGCGWPGELLFDEPGGLRAVGCDPQVMGWDYTFVQ